MNVIIRNENGEEIDRSFNLSSMEEIDTFIKMMKPELSKGDTMELYIK